VGRHPGICPKIAATARVRLEYTEIEAALRLDFAKCVVARLQSQPFSRD
jgi:hypothetical protein